MAQDAIAEYIDGFPPDVRERLETIRALVKESVPEAQEKISYRIPTMTLDGKYFLYFAGFERHVSIYPVSATGDAELDAQLAPYLSGKGTLKFPLDEPLPIPLIREVIRHLVERRRQR